MTNSPANLWNSTFRVRPVVAVVGSDDRTVLLLLDADEPVPIALEGSAASIWSLVDGQRATSSVVAEVASEFHVEIEVIRPEVESFLVQLESEGYLERDSSTSNES